MLKVWLDLAHNRLQNNSNCLKTPTHLSVLWSSGRVSTASCSLQSEQPIGSTGRLPSTCSCQTSHVDWWWVEAPILTVNAPTRSPPSEFISSRPHGNSRAQCSKLHRRFSPVTQVFTAWCRLCVSEMLGVRCAQRGRPTTGFPPFLFFFVFDWLQTERRWYDESTRCLS